MKVINRFVLIALIFLAFSNYSLSATKDSELYVIGFGSCITEKRDQPIWDAIKKENIDEFFFMGDNVYGDSEDGLLVEMRKSYEKQRQMFPKWVFDKKLNAIWDDHDYGKNDGGFEYPLKKEAQKLFLEFWNVNKEDPRHNREGIYFNEVNEILGSKVNLIALDTRYHRSPLDQADKPYSPTLDKTKTILGERQWKWLEEVLNKDSDLVIIVSSIQILPTNHGFEKWYNFPHERTKLLNLLKTTRKPIIIISGDRHKAGLYKDGRIIEMTSSSMNKPISKPITMLWDLLSKETDDLLQGDMYSRENYGIIKFNKNKISVTLKDIKGEEILSVEI
jgi:alkaline phosphatase D